MFFFISSSVFDFTAKVLDFDHKVEYLAGMSIASYIKEDLATRIRAGRDLPARLTFEALSHHYEVSHTPVRTALAELVEEGLLKKGANRRLAINGRRVCRSRAKRKTALPAPPRDPYRVVADDLVQRSFEGNAIYLREQAAANRYGISRPVIRNIFNRLVGTGLLEHIPRHGWRLRPFRKEDLDAFLEIRELLELKAMELARPHLVEEDLRAILNRNVLPASANALPQVDNSLHAHIIDKAGNPYITDFFDRHGEYHENLFAWESTDRQMSIETVRQHHDILNALLSKDWRAARKAMAVHIRANHSLLSSLRPKTQDQR